MAGLFEALSPHVSHVLFGVLGGYAYLVRQRMKRQRVELWDIFGRLFFGGIGAWVLTVGLGLPNHTNSILVGYFAIDVWDALGKRFELATGWRLPLAHDHDAADPPPKD